MARRTKSDALATRDVILDCAERMFIRQGVSQTTLQHIALEAGVTRGAIYWHFEDKAAMFKAMLQRVKMPLESAMQTLALPDSADPMGDLIEYAMRVFLLTESDPRARRVFEIVTMKIEYVDEMDAIRERRVQIAAAWMASAELRMHIAIQQGQARRDVNAYAIALGLWVLIDGLLRAWMSAPESFSLSQIGQYVITTHLGSLRCRTPGPAATGSRDTPSWSPPAAVVEVDCIDAAGQAWAVRF